MTTKKGIRVLVTLSSVFFLSSIAWAVDCPLPDTGQTKCYDKDSEITCPNPGQDFYGQDAQYICNPQSYTSLAGGIMVQDNVTGLVWEGKTDDGSIHDRDDEYNWDDAQSVFITTLNNDNFGGYSDWRLPTAKELTLIVDRDRYNPSINTNYFPNTQSYYWSSTTNAGYPSFAWYVNFYGGLVSNTLKSVYGNYVRAVRSGPCGAFENFIDNGDGTVTNTDTGLMWQKDTDPDTYEWQDALSYCENLTLAGYDDWRLPNVNELQSLVDYERYSPTINTTYFPNTQSSYYWSSTTTPGYPDFAWYVYFSDGGVSFYYVKSYPRYVRAVRAGQCGSFDTSTTTTISGLSSTTTTIYGNTTTTTTIDAGELYIYGNIVDSEDNGVQGIPVVLKFNSKEGGSEQDTSLTDANGGFIFPDLDENTYYVYPESVHAYSPEKEEVELKNEPVYVKFIQLEGSSGCPATEIYGANSDETNLLRALRDNVLKNDPAGRELIKLYYAYSPLVVEMMKNDIFKEEVKENIDLMLRLLVTRDYIN